MVDNRLYLGMYKKWVFSIKWGIFVILMLAQIVKEDGRQELEIVMGNEHIVYSFQNWVSS